MPVVFDPSNIITPDELAERLKVPATWVYEKTRRRAGNKNRLPAMRIGRYLRFSWADVSAWLESTKQLTARKGAA